jgi:hypothetical protein
MTMTMPMNEYGQFYRDSLPKGWRALKMGVPVGMTALGLGQEIEERVAKEFAGRKWCWKLENDDLKDRTILFAAPRKAILNFITYMYP